MVSIVGLAPSHLLIPSRIVKRVAIVARLFYHTAMCLLQQIHPTTPSNDEQMLQQQLHHAHQICGIVAHGKDRGVASVALRSLAVAAECLVVRREQQEVLDVFSRIRKETGWRVDFIYKDLKTKWGWEMEETQQAAQGQESSHFVQSEGLLPPPPQPPPQTQQLSMPTGILNPLLSTADFSLPNHPYQQDYHPRIISSSKSRIPSLTNICDSSLIRNLIYKFKHFTSAWRHRLGNMWGLVMVRGEYLRTLTFAWILHSVRRS